MEVIYSFDIMYKTSCFRSLTFGRIKYVVMKKKKEEKKVNKYLCNMIGRESFRNLGNVILSWLQKFLLCLCVIKKHNTTVTTREVES